MRCAVAAGALALLTLAAGCGSGPPTARPAMRPAEAREFIAGLMPARVADRSGWATDLYAAFASLRLDATPENICAALAVAEQESSFQVDPVVPKLGDSSRRAPWTSSVGTPARCARRSDRKSIV